MADVSKEYAEALFAVACERDAENDVMTALDSVLCAFDENPEYAELLASPGISLGERLGAIETTFGGSVPECVLSYLMLLCEKGRIAIFRESVGEYRNLLKEIGSTFEILEVETMKEADGLLNFNVKTKSKFSNNKNKEK